MLETLHKIFLTIHIPAGFIALILFWIPIAVKKGSPLHRKVGWYYYIAMWLVLISSVLLSLVNLSLGRQLAALYLGYLTIITAYPLWYSYEILQKDRVWTDRYMLIRRTFLVVMTLFALYMIGLGAIKFNFKGMGTMMVFFGMIAIPSVRNLSYSKEKAMDDEGRMKMHIQGTIITGIAAYTAFFAFGGSRFLLGVLKLHQQWMMVPWLLPTILGVVYMSYMRRKYKRIA